MVCLSARRPNLGSEDNGLAKGLEGREGDASHAGQCTIPRLKQSPVILPHGCEVGAHAAGEVGRLQERISVGRCSKGQAMLMTVSDPKQSAG